MKRASAEAISNQQILGELERGRSARDITGSWLMWLRCPEIVREVPRPGQFVMVRCGEATLPRPFSIHRVERDAICLFYAIWENGPGTQWLSHRQRGDKVDIFGPLGNSFSVKPDAKNLLLVAGGTGIAPLWFLAKETQKQGHSVTLLRGASGEQKPSGALNPSQLYPSRMLPRGTRTRSTETKYEGHTVTGQVTELIPNFADWADQVFACGPLPMYQHLALHMQDVGLAGKPVQVSMEMRMGCGLGVCYGCTINTRQGIRQACKDGPVFKLEDIVWDELARV